MRRILSSLQKENLIETKTNKVRGKRVLMCKPNIENIINKMTAMVTETAILSGMNEINHETAQELPQTATLSCIEIAPTGQSGRLQPDKMAVSIYTEDNLQNIVCVEDRSNYTHTQFLTSNPKCKTAFQEKFTGYDVTIEQLFEDCKSYAAGKEVTENRFLIWINNEKITNYKKNKIVSKSSIDELELIQTYALALKENRMEFYFSNESKRSIAKGLYDKERKRHSSL